MCTVKHWTLITMGAAALLGFAVPAHADTDGDADAMFLSAVDRAGIEYTDAREAVGVGREVCNYLQAGHHTDGAARALRISNRTLSAKNAAKFVTFAQAAYCPSQPAG